MVHKITAATLLTEVCTHDYENTSDSILLRGANHICIFFYKIARADICDKYIIAVLTVSMWDALRNVNPLNLIKAKFE